MAVAVVLAAVLAGTGGAVAAPVNLGDGGDEYPGSLQGDDSQTVPEILSDDIQAEIVDTSEESITVELRFPTDTFAGEEQFPQDTFTGEQILTDQQLDTSAAPTQVAGREGMVTPNPAPGGAGETATATTAEVEKITEDDGISYFLTVRTADLDLSMSPGEELTGAMLMYPPETAPEFALDDLADSPGEPSISPRTDQDPNRLIVNPNVSPGEPSDLATAQSNP